MMMNSSAHSARSKSRRIFWRVTCLARSRVWRSVFVFCLVGVALGAVLLAGSALAASFSDVNSNTYANPDYPNAVSALSDRGVITGFPDGTFRPHDPVTRQQFAKMIVKLLGLTVTGNETCPFADVSAQIGSDPFYPSKYIAVCAAHGITTGKTATIFAPNDYITRAQLLTMVVRGARQAGVSLSDPTPEYYAGTSSGSHFFRTWVDDKHAVNAQTAEVNGLLYGIWPGADNTWDAYQNATRGEVAQILWQLLQKMGGTSSSTTTTTLSGPHEGDRKSGVITDFSIQIGGGTITGTTATVRLSDGSTVTADVLAGLTISVGTQCVVEYRSGKWVVIQVTSTTTTTQPTTTTTIPGATLVASDDFSDPASGWPNLSSWSNGYYYRYEGGAYVVEIQPGSEMWLPFTYSNIDLTNCRVEADLTIASGDADSGVGLVLRYQDSNNFYLFQTNGAGNFDSFRHVQGLWGDNGWTSSSAVNPMGQSNHVVFAASGNVLSGWINGTQVLSATDSSFSHGSAGFYVEAPGSMPVKAIIDNLKIWRQ
jgi:S-layer homology domain